jgi:phosphoglycerate dehydrogenase-like enzyme
MNTEKQPLVIITHPIPDDWIKELTSICEVVIGPEDGRGIHPSIEKYLPIARAILCLLDDPITANLISKAKQLQVISNMAVGTDNIDISACTRRGIPVGNTPGVLTAGTADLTLALLLAAARKVIPSSRDAREGRWANWDPAGWLGADITGKTVGIFGAGKIGSAVAHRLAAFDAKIIFTNRSPKPELIRDLNAEQVELDQLLTQSDFLCLHVPLSAETEGIIDRSALQKMKKSAILINAARGPVVKTEALVEALQKGWIQAAGLDVTDPEPLPSDHILYSLDNCLVTPHIGSATYGTRRTMASIAAQNIMAGLKNVPLLHCVNPEVYQDPN